MPPHATENEVTPQRLMEMAWGYAPPLMLEAAIEVGLFAPLAEGARSLEELSTATGASTRGLRALANGLVGLGLLAKEGDRYALTPESAAFLVPGRPGYHGEFFRHVSRQLLPKWMQITEVVRTGRPAMAVNAHDEGAAFFAEFVEALFPLGYRAAQVLGQHLGVPRTAEPLRVLDIAAGSGVWSIALAEQSPKVEVTVVDWPEVTPVTRRVAERHGVADRYRYVEGDLQDAAFGGPHHVAVLGHILHSEGEARSRRLLRKVHDSLAPGGTIAIVEIVPNEERTGPPMPLIFAVNMLVATEGGDTFTFGEMSAWLGEAGFTDVRQLEAPAPSPLILATRPA